MLFDFEMYDVGRERLEQKKWIDYFVSVYSVIFVAALMFPQIKNSMEYIKYAGGTAKADIWRLLVLWEYGGIYTDMDNAPGNNEVMQNVVGLQDTGGFYVPRRSYHYYHHCQRILLLYRTKQQDLYDIDSGVSRGERDSMRSITNSFSASSLNNHFHQLRFVSVEIDV